MMTLSNREKQVVSQVALGLTNKEVAARLGLSEGTVKTYLSNIKSKDPEHGTRYTLVKHLLRDQERVRAIRLSEWLKKWEGSLLPECKAEIHALLATQVSEILK